MFKVYVTITLIALLTSNCGKVGKMENQKRLDGQSNAAADSQNEEKSGGGDPKPSDEPNSQSLNDQTVVFSDTPSGTSKFNVSIPLECCIAVPGKVFLRQCLDYDFSKCIVPAK